MDEPQLGAIGIEGGALSKISVPFESSSLGWMLLH